MLTKLKTKEAVKAEQGQEEAVFRQARSRDHEGNSVGWSSQVAGAALGVVRAGLYGGE